MEIEFEFFFFLLRLKTEADIFRHFRNESNKRNKHSSLTSIVGWGCTWNVRNHCIGREAKKFFKSVYGWNHGTNSVIPGLRVLFWFQYRHEGFSTVRSPSRLSTSARGSPCALHDLHSTLQLRLVSLPRIYVISELPTVRDEPFHKHESFVTQVEYEKRVKVKSLHRWRQMTPMVSLLATGCT